MDLAETMNLGCLCTTLQPQRLHEDLSARVGHGRLAQRLPLEQPHLFATTPVFISDRDLAMLERSVSALHRVVALPPFQAAALARSSVTAPDWGPRGAFMGYDFHLGSQGPRLIEINTNAGGAFLHAPAARSHSACCEAMHRRFHLPADLHQFDQAVIDMFQAEWRAQRAGTALRSVAIVDDEPDGQYLAPEFELARALFESRGIAAVVADPRELQWDGAVLRHPALPEGGSVDLVYNRLTDFALAEPRHAALRAAYDSGGAVVTPGPRTHALHADKRNLVSLGDDALLAAWGAADEDRELLRTVVPATQLVTADNAEALWGQRRQLFFKPAAGFGSRGAYRGDKLTRRVWADIVAGGYVAQALVPPSERLVDVGGVPTRLKVDVRAYAYDGRILLLAARTYAGQTTNFRTAGGGFSPVVVLPSGAPEDGA